MSTSKKGEFLADLCVEALKMGDNVSSTFCKPTDLLAFNYFLRH